MLAVHQLAAERGDRTLFRAVSFALERGELLEVSGSNGSGKTTLLRVLCGLMAPLEGEVHWRGETIQTLREDYCRELAYIGHLNGLKDEFTPLENLRFTAQLRGQTYAADAAARLLSELGLSKRQQQLPSKVLSQGQKRRVALARALFGGAPLWILDEPFAALDVDAIALVAQRMGEHCARGGLLVLSSHQDVPIACARAHQLRLGAAARADANDA